MNGDMTNRRKCRKKGHQWDNNETLIVTDKLTGKEVGKILFYVCPVCLKTKNIKFGRVPGYVH